MKLINISFKLSLLIAISSFLNVMCNINNFLEETYDSFLEKGNLNDYIDSIVSKLNDKKMSCYLTKKKINKINDEKKFNLNSNKPSNKTTNITSYNANQVKEYQLVSNNVLFLCDFLKNFKELPSNSINPTLVLESSETHCKKEEALFISIMAKLSFKRKIYQPIGVSYDLENLKGNWKSFLILMGKEGLENKLHKICFNPFHLDVLIVLEEYENSCNSIVEFLENSNILSNEDPLYIEHHIESNNYEELKTNSSHNLKSDIKQTSFLESSISNELTSESSLKNYNNAFNANSNTNSNNNISVSKIMSKFSFDELSKIKSVIKFAKKNNILDKIYSSNGEIEFNLNSQNNSTSLNDIFNEIKNEETKISNIENVLNDMKNNLSLIKNNLQKLNSEKNMSKESYSKNEIFNNNNNDSNNNRRMSDINRLIEHSKVQDPDEDILTETSNIVKDKAKYSNLNSKITNRKSVNSNIINKSNDRKPPQNNLKSPVTSNNKIPRGIHSYAEKYKIELGKKMKYSNNADDDDLEMFNSP